MRPSSILLLSLFSALLTFAAGCRSNQTPSAPVSPSLSPTEKLRGSSTIEASNAFGFDLLHRLDADKTPGAGNVFVSPFSIMQAMTMVTNGAGGETQAEMLRSLHLNGTALASANADQKKLNAALSSTTKDSQNSLVIANALWVNQGLKLAPDFVRIAHDFYDAPAKNLDFRDASGAANTINQWVETTTQGKIKTLFSAEDLSGPPPADVVLANAVYFKAAWQTPFDEKDTMPKPFTLESGAQKTIPTMHQTVLLGEEGDVNYYKGDGFAMASLLYDGGSTHTYRSMILLLPDAPDGIGKLLAELTPENWKAWQKKLSSHVEMDLSLPRFTLEYETSLIPSLTQMGIHRAFAPGEADFTPMGLKNYGIGVIKHKTFLDINEKGTAAAAVTGIGMVGAAAPMPSEKVVFHVDRPFVCAIVDDETGTILFLGVIRDPEAMN